MYEREEALRFQQEVQGGKKTTKESSSEDEMGPRPIDANKELEGQKVRYLFPLLFSLLTFCIL